MKLKIFLIILAIVVFLSIFFIPVPKGPYKDGGTKEYAALTYKIVDWNRLTATGKYDETKVYFFPNNFRSIDDLWDDEADQVETTFIATVVQKYAKSVIVEPVPGCEIFSDDARISFGTAELDDIGAEVGSTVQITFKGAVMESYPEQIHPVKWEISGNMRHLEYTEQWLDKETAEKCDYEPFDHIVITQIYADCFFAQTVIPMPWTIKLNGQLSEEWCVGDQIVCTYENVYHDSENYRYEVDLLSVEASDWQPDPNACYKPVIYLYPEEKTEVSVKLQLDGQLTCTYPAYNGEWQVTAAPDGTLTDENGQTYNYLYWEGETNAKWDMKQGFCVKGADTAAFLEWALEELGLNRKEANEFIVYWLPLMEQNPYNIISFQAEAYTQAAELQIDPAPDTLIRVFMVWQKTESYVNLEPQDLTAPQRTGFTVVEWGGTEVK